MLLTGRLGGVIHLPGALNDVYEATLRKYNLLEKARHASDVKAVYGGKSREDTEEHLATRFLNSVSRVQCVLLDPHRSLADIPRDLITTLSSHRIAVLDVPCGAGAATLSMLETVKELRKAGVLPTTPLSIDIIGADISPDALDLFCEQHSALSPGLSNLGITTTLSLREWDAADVQQTNDLLDDLLANAGVHNEHLVLVTNFSGESKNLLRQFEPSFNQIGIRLSGKVTKRNTIIWIEPDMRTSRGLFSTLADLFAKFKRLQRSPDASVPCLSCSYSWFLRLQNKSIRSSLIVHRYSRGTSQ